MNALAAAADPSEQVYLVPAFVGLGAPWWDAQARGAMFGLTRKSGVAELARAALEAVGYQTRDLLEAMRADWPDAAGGTVLRVDGGMAASDVTMQFLADILAAPVDRPIVMETTALGAAYLAGHAAGLCPDLARLCRDLEARATLRAANGWRHARAQMGGLARCGCAHAELALKHAEPKKMRRNALSDSLCGAFSAENRKSTLLENALMCRHGEWRRQSEQ